METDKKLTYINVRTNSKKQKTRLTKGTATPGPMQYNAAAHTAAAALVGTDPATASTRTNTHKLSRMESPKYPPLLAKPFLAKCPRP